MTIDFVNGVFEAGGAVFTWLNAYKLSQDKEVRGVYWPLTGFFSAWGIWNLYYYPSLGQIYSMAGGAFLVVGNLWWFILAIQYRKASRRLDTQPGT